MDLTFLATGAAATHGKTSEKLIFSSGVPVLGQFATVMETLPPLVAPKLQSESDTLLVGPQQEEAEEAEGIEEVEYSEGNEDIEIDVEFVDTVEPQQEQVAHAVLSLSIPALPPVDAGIKATSGADETMPLPKNPHEAASFPKRRDAALAFTIPVQNNPRTSVPVTAVQSIVMSDIAAPTKADLVSSVGPSAPIVHENRLNYAPENAPETEKMVASLDLSKKLPLEQDSSSIEPASTKKLVHVSGQAQLDPPEQRQILVPSITRLAGSEGPVLPHVKNLNHGMQQQIFSAVLQPRAPQVASTTEVQDIAVPIQPIAEGELSPRFEAPPSDAQRSQASITQPPGSQGVAGKADTATGKAETVASISENEFRERPKDVQHHIQKPFRAAPSLPAPVSGVDAVTPQVRLDTPLDELSLAPDVLPATDRTAAVESVVALQMTTNQKADTIQPPAPVRQVLHHLAETQLSKGDRIEITLSPDELGRVHLSARQTDHGVILMVQAERPETLDLMRRHLPDLLQDLQQMGFDDISYSEGRSEQQARNQSGKPPEQSDTAIDSTPRFTSSGLDLRL